MVSETVSSTKTFMRHILTQITFLCFTVGGGTSGAVLASRLTEDEDVEVLLIEAGGDESRNEAVDVPLFSDQVRGSHADWSYRTVPQRYACKGHVDQVSSCVIPHRPLEIRLQGTCQPGQFLCVLKRIQHDAPSPRDMPVRDTSTMQVSSCIHEMEYSVTHWPLQ